MENKILKKSTDIPWYQVGFDYTEVVMWEGEMQCEHLLPLNALK